eukprot:CAMPEP_0173383992 /NCGR_PEP_ID=MMETSP1356-20130122/6564_1 /TAXON_ID=77927 ORGANISM="Hemiselmis virescens, Strain PCC157" /NCGR_SAMPLE_ID=MMETSP1356 /ASSEMBLY_ACC=CAM_ASM_000847 /LENGTH=104 /DNA_ID=CAMNT_0014339133 /DNA_START=8 /DNA_END=322 /DNA_ORIENTATION=+
MASRVAMVGGVAAVGGLGYYMMSGSSAKADAPKQTAEQKKSAMLRSRLSGHHPNVSGGDDCHSRSGQTGMSLKHLNSGRSTQANDSVTGETSKRQVSGGTVIVK